MWQDEYMLTNGEINMRFASFVGKNITEFRLTGDELIVRIGGAGFKLYHAQDCCEHVRIEDYEFSGPSEDFTGAVFHDLEEVEGETHEPEYAESYTWTFYKLKTSKGELWMRWLGESNGYYSESVDIAFWRD